MVEMTETANILHHAGPRSLLLLDEIGRGTSTFDGLSIAWAVVESLHALPGGAPRTLFATHYHELTELAVELESVFNLRMAVREWQDKVIFLHRVEQGASDRSYGIHVARLAGVPRAVIERAKEILANLERDQFGRNGQPRRGRKRGGLAPPRAQKSLFSLLEEPRPDHAVAEVLEKLMEQDFDQLAPIDALNLLQQWQRKLRE
jgi:DNA mismatch repair protein MutS